MTTRDHHQESGDPGDGGVAVSAPEPGHLAKQSDATIGGLYLIKIKCMPKRIAYINISQSEELDTILIQLGHQGYLCS